MFIPRAYDSLENYLQPNKVLVLYGPRQVGKTTLLTRFLDRFGGKSKLLTGDNVRVQALFSELDFESILSLSEGYDLLAIDEAQRIPNIGLGLKILVDHVPNLSVIATGSSSFDLSGKIGEPLTGRKNILTLFPIAQLELKSLYNTYELKEKLSEFLIFGSYPEVVTSETRRKKVARLEEIAESYLLKDVLALERVKNAKLLLDLLRLLAFQIGGEVSLNELGRQLGIDTKTVRRYLDIFEKAFILYNVRGFSRNLRKEITKKSKYYFYDNGIRNALIANFNPPDIRNDMGALWENFVFMGRLKKRAYQNIPANIYFWRTWDGQEIDLVEEREGRLHGYECKWQDKKIKPPRAWTEKYPEASFEVITKDTYLSFVC
jgi:predicted AAA+ superfamily ATPase